MTTDLKTSVSFKADGTTKKFFFNFDYINKQFIKVSVGDRPLSYPTDYSVIDKSVELLKEVPKKDQIVRVYRQTTTERLVDWQDGSYIKASQMTLETLQQLHLIEEAQDYPILNSMSRYPDGINYNALGNRIINVGNPQEQGDAVNKGYMESVSDGFVSRNTAIESNIRSMQDDVSSKKSAVDTTLTEVKRVETSVKASETSVRQDKETVKTLLDNGKTTITEAVNEGKTTIKTMVDTAKEYDSTAKQSAISASSSADMSHKWAVATDSPDGLADSGSTTGKTMSSRSWALQAKTSGTAAEQAKNDANSYAGTAKSNADKAVSEAAKATSASQTATGAATKATTEADRAKAEADRAAGIAGGNFLSLDNGGTVKGKTTFIQNVTLNGTPSADNDGVNKKYVDNITQDLSNYIQNEVVPKVTVEGNTIAFGNVKIGVD